MEQGTRVLAVGATPQEQIPIPPRAAEQIKRLAAAMEATFATGEKIQQGLEIIWRAGYCQGAMNVLLDEQDALADEIVGNDTIL